MAAHNPLDNSTTTRSFIPAALGFGLLLARALHPRA